MTASRFVNATCEQQLKQRLHTCALLHGNCTCGHLKFSGTKSVSLGNLYVMKKRFGLECLFCEREGYSEPDLGVGNEQYPAGHIRARALS